LRGAALDDVAQGLLPAVGLRQIVLVKQEQAYRQHRGDGDDGNHETVKADAGGLHGDDFAVAVKYAEGDRRGMQHGQRRDLVRACPG